MNAVYKDVGGNKVFTFYNNGSKKVEIIGELSVADNEEAEYPNYNPVENCIQIKSKGVNDGNNPYSISAKVSFINKGMYTEASKLCNTLKDLYNK